MMPFPFPTVEAQLDSVLSLDPIVFCEVGARKGGKRFRAIGKYVRYYGFEPDEPQATLLKRDLAGVFGDVHVLQHAVMDRSGAVSINVLRHRGCSSVLMPNRSVIDLYMTRRADTNRWPDYFDVVDTYQCEAQCLDDIALAEGIAELDFLGLDTQGTEMQILDGGRSVLSRTTFVHVEMETVPLYKDQALLAEVMGWLTDAGFRLLAIEKPERISRFPAGVDDRVDQGEIVSIDGLFYRDSSEEFDSADLSAASVLRRMLLLHELEFRTLAIATGRRFLERRTDSAVRALVDAMIDRYKRDNASAQSVRTRIRRMLRRLKPYGHA